MFGVTVNGEFLLYIKIKLNLEKRLLRLHYLSHNFASLSIVHILTQRAFWHRSPLDLPGGVLLKEQLLF